MKHQQYTPIITKPIIYHCHTLELCQPSTKIYPLSDFIQTAFIDPGTVSCAFRIVRYYYTLEKYQVLFFAVCNFGKKIEDVYQGIERELLPKIQYFSECHYIVIEKQPLIRRDIFQTSQHLISFFVIHTKNQGFCPVVVEVDSKLKTVGLGGPSTAKKNGGESLKKWAQTRALQILQERDDEVSLKILSMSLYKAKQDLSDVVCYESAWWIYYRNVKEIPKISI
jgi:hypothetical protein